MKFIIFGIDESLPIAKSPTLLHREGTVVEAQARDRATKHRTSMVMRDRRSCITGVATHPMLVNFIHQLLIQDTHAPINQDYRRLLMGLQRMGRQILLEIVQDF
jgi:hypothetical protein